MALLYRRLPQGFLVGCFVGIYKLGEVYFSLKFHQHSADIAHHMVMTFARQFGNLPAANREFRAGGGGR